MFNDFYAKLFEFNYDELTWPLVETIKDQMNNFTDIRGGKFTMETMEQVHPAAAVLADFIINWYEASVYKRKWLDIEDARTAKQEEIERLNQIKLDAIAAEEAEAKARKK